MSERLGPQNDPIDFVSFSPDTVDTTDDYSAVEYGLTALDGLKGAVGRMRLTSPDQGAIELALKEMAEAGLSAAEQRIIMIMATDVTPAGIQPDAGLQ